VREVQIGEHVLPLALNTPLTVLRPHRVACTPDLRQLMVGESVSNSEGEDENLFGLGPVDFAHDLAVELGQKGSELQCWQNSVSGSMGKKQPLLAEFGSTPSRQGSGFAAVDKTSKTPEGAGVQSLQNPRVLVWIRRDLFIARRFRAADCFPISEGERLPYPKSFRFSRDWWSWREGGKEICRQILQMAPGGRGGYKKPGGRGAQADGVAKPPQKTQLPQVLIRLKSIIFDAPCLFLHHLLSVSLHFVALLCIFRN
jgi:hypothetical protein